MNKNELLKLVDSLNMPKTEYYILSSGSLLLYGLREKAGDLDLCVSNELFDKLKKPNECGFYQISKDIEIIPSNKDDFKMTIKDNYPVEDLKTILKFKQERNTPKDQKDIENIIKYLENNKI